MEPYPQFKHLAKFILLIPLLGNWFGFDFEQSKVGAFFIITFLTLSFTLASHWKRVLKPSLIMIFALIWLGVLLFTSLQGIHPQISLFGREPYFQGWITYVCLFLFYLCIRAESSDPRWWNFGWTFISLIISLWAIGQWALMHLSQLLILNYSGRPIASFGSPNLYAGFLLLTLPIQWRCSPLVAIISMVAILVSGSRAAQVLMLLTIILMFIHQAKSLTTKLLLILLIELVIVAGWGDATQWIRHQVQTELVQPFNAEWQFVNAPEKRILFWPVLINQLQQRPLYGYGLESTTEVFHSYFPEYGINYPAWPALKDLNLDRAHNYLLDLAVWSGALGIGAWTLFILLLFWKSRFSFWTIPLLIYCLWVQVQIQSIVHLLFFWWLVGQIDKQKFAIMPFHGHVIRARNSAKIVSTGK